VAGDARSAYASLLTSIDDAKITTMHTIVPRDRKHAVVLAAIKGEGGYLPRGVPMVKRVLALHGQTVCRDQLTITVDKIEVGEARERDSRGRPLPIWQGCHVIADGEVFLMNWQSADSLDGRYFGALPTTAIVGRAEPRWTDEEG